MATNDDSTLASIKRMLRNYMVDSEWATGTAEYHRGAIDALQIVLEESYGLRPELTFVAAEAAD